MAFRWRRDSAGPVRKHEVITQSTSRPCSVRAGFFLPACKGRHQWPGLNSEPGRDSRHHEFLLFSLLTLNGLTEHLLMFTSPMLSCFLVESGGIQVVGFEHDGRARMSGPESSGNGESQNRPEAEP